MSFAKRYLLDNAKIIYKEEIILSLYEKGNILYEHETGNRILGGHDYLDTRLHFKRYDTVQIEKIFFTSLKNFLKRLLIISNLEMKKYNVETYKIVLSINVFLKEDNTFDKSIFFNKSVFYKATTKEKDTSLEDFIQKIKHQINTALLKSTNQQDILIRLKVERKEEEEELLIFSASYLSCYLEYRYIWLVYCVFPD